jgi:hypothetical protein
MKTTMTPYERILDTFDLNEGIKRLCSVISFTIGLITVIVCMSKTEDLDMFQNTEAFVVYIITIICTVLATLLATYGSLIILLILCATIKWIKEGFKQPD